MGDGHDTPPSATGCWTRGLATLDVLWLLGVVVYTGLQMFDMVPPLPAGAYISAVALGVGGAVLLFSGGR